MSDVYLMLGLGLDQCSETQDYLSSGRPMQLVGHNADSWYWWWLFAYIQLLEKKKIQSLKIELLQVQETTCHPWQVFEADWNYRWVRP